MLLLVYVVVGNGFECVSKSRENSCSLQIVFYLKSHTGRISHFLRQYSLSIYLFHFSKGLLWLVKKEHRERANTQRVKIRQSSTFPYCIWPGKNADTCLKYLSLVSLEFLKGEVSVLLIHYTSCFFSKSKDNFD